MYQADIPDADGEGPQLRAELAELRHRALLGDLAPALAHECSNFLNVVLLQLAVMEMDLPDSIGGQLEEIRRQGGKLQKLLEQFHSYRKSRSQALVAISLESAWGTLEHEARSLWPQPAAPLPRVMATDSDIRHLLELFLTHALHCGRETVTLEIVPLGDRVHLLLHCPHAGEEGEALEWLACQSLARRVLGKAYSKLHPDGSLDYIIDLQQAK